jgi:hypothetical protein
MNPQNESSSTEAGVGSFFQTVARLAATVLGLALMVIGMIYAIRIMDALFAVISDPGSMKAIIDQWIQVVGEDTAVIKDEKSISRGLKSWSLLFWAESPSFSLGCLSASSLLVRAGGINHHQRQGSNQEGIGRSIRSFGPSFVENGFAGEARANLGVRSPTDVLARRPDERSGETA